MPARRALSVAGAALGTDTCVAGTAIDDGLNGEMEIYRQVCHVLLSLEEFVINI